MQDIIHITQKNREALVKLSKNHSLDALNTIPAGFNNNIFWNMGHLVAIQQLLVYGLSQTPFTADRWVIDTFKNKTKPERYYTQEDYDAVTELMVTTVPRMYEDYQNKIFTTFNPFISKSLETNIKTVDGIIQFNMFHEGLHTGVIQKYLQLLK